MFGTLLLVCCAGLLAVGYGVQLQFERTNDGFFYRGGEVSDNGWPLLPHASLPHVDGEPVAAERFTLRDPREPALVRADHGPFTTRQSVPVPLTMESANITDPVHFHPRPVHVTAHLVTSEVSRERPVLRVLLHAGQSGGRGGHAPGHHLQRLCATVMVSRERQILTSYCRPDENGVCLAEVILPAAWWPQEQRRQAHGGDVKKPTKNQASVAYFLSRAESGGGDGCGSGSGARAGGAVQGQPVTAVGVVPLTQGRDLRAVHRLDAHVSIVVPQGALFPKTRVYIPVYVQQGPRETENDAIGFTLRARVRNGLHVVGTELASDKWNISVTSNKRRGSITITAYVTGGGAGGDESTVTPAAAGSVLTTEDHPLDSAYEVFTLILQVDEYPELRDGGKVVWRMQYLSGSAEVAAEDRSRDRRRRKLITRLNLQKDDTQVVLPIAKSTDLVNTAMLTGAQVTEQLRVYVVTQSGDVADVTLKSTCKSTDESVLKVSSSCTSVYLDGSEARGTQNASVIVDYGPYHGVARFRVWVPEEPLEIQIPDPKLSQIRGWKVRTTVSNKHPNDIGSMIKPTPSYRDGEQQCQLRFQQTPIEVYAKFVSRDDNSGRVSYVAGRKASLRVTDLVRGHLRVADPHVAALRDNLLIGKSQGRTKLQLLSPITGAELASREFRVTTDKVTVSTLEASVVSGLQLAISRLGDNEYLAVAGVSRQLTAQYQEGLLDMWLQFSDDTRTPLSAVDPSDFYLDVEALEPRVVALAPQSNQLARVLAIGPGKGKLLKITLEMDERCSRRRSEALASTYAHVEVQFAGQVLREGIQNDASHLLDRPELYGTGGREGLQQVLEDARKAGKLKVEQVVETHTRRPGHRLQPLEIGMFILLGVFCVVIAIFIVACFVYASQVKKANKAAGGEQSHSNAQDWVWLGRSGLDSAAARGVTGQNQLALSDMNANVDRFPSQQQQRDIRITVNPRHQPTPTPAPQQQQKQQKQPQQRQQKVDDRTFVKKRHPRPIYQNVSCMYPVTEEDPPPPPVPPHQSPPELQPPPPPPLPPAAPPTAAAAAGSPAFVSPSPPPCAVRRANIVENPLLRRHDSDEQPAGGFGFGMDYEELMRYFDNLKESTA